METQSAMNQEKQFKTILLILFIILVVSFIIYGIYVIPVLIKKNYSVIFKLNNGEENVIVSVEKNGIVSRINDPLMDGYIFMGWVSGNNIYDFNTKINSNLVLEAVWLLDSEVKEIISNSGLENEVTGGNNSPGNSNLGNGSSNNNNNNMGNNNINIPNNIEIPIIRYQVYFDSNGGSAIDSVSVIKYGLIDRPKDPSRTGYRFLGWKYGDIYYDFHTKVTSDITLVASWEKIDNSVPSSSPTNTPAPSSPAPSSPTPSPTNSPSPSPTTTSTPTTNKLGITLSQISQTPSGTWAREKVIRVIYTAQNKKNTAYYIKSTVDTKLRSGSIDAICGQGSHPDNCKSVTTTSISANNWYRLKITSADFLYTKNATIYAEIIDSKTKQSKQEKMNITNIDNAKPSTPTVKYNGGQNAHQWQNNYNIDLNSSSVSGISKYEVDINGDGNANLTLYNSNYIPSNNTNSCKVRFRAVSNTGIASDWTGVHHIHMDTEPPGKTVVDTGSYIKGTVTSNEIVERTFSATDNVGIAYYQWSNSDCTKWAGNEKANTSYIPLYGSQTNIACHRAVDYAGNVGPWSDVTVVKISTTYQKKAAFFGDSITWGIGCCTDSAGNNCLSWANCIGCNRDYTAYNFGKPGWTISKINNYHAYMIPSVLDSVSNGYYDFIILQGGTNDIGNIGVSGNNVRLGSYNLYDFSGNYDITTFLGGLESYLYKATRYWPNARIGYIITYQTPNNFGPRATMSAEYYAKMKEVLNKWKIPYLDLYFGNDIYLGSGRSFNDILQVYSQRYLQDTLHLSCEGDMVLAQYVQAWMRLIPKYSR